MICTYHNVTEFVSILLHLNYSAIIWESVISATITDSWQFRMEIMFQMFT